jgi:pimeloyl-ACP methyl ester carboxylesterase
MEEKHLGCPANPPDPDRQGVNMSLTTQSLEKNGGRIAFDDTGGAGPLLIAAPGMGDRRGVYRHLSPFLTEAGFRLVTFAMASDYLSLLDRLGASQAVLVGNSKTASSVVIAATSQPDRVSGLVMLGPFARQVPVKWWQMLLFGLTLGGPWGRTAWVSYYKKSLYPGPKPADHNQYVAALSRNLAEPGRFRAFREQVRDSHAESGSRLGRLRRPALIVMGTADPDFPNPEQEARTLGSILKGEVLLVEGSGHYPQADNPEKVAPAIIDFVRRVTAKEG